MTVHGRDLIFYPGIKRAAAGPQLQSALRNGTQTAPLGIAWFHECPDEILGGAMQYTAQKVAAKVAAGVSANRGRPAENGAAASGASGARFDVAHSTKEQRMALIRRAANGERIEF